MKFRYEPNSEELIITEASRIEYNQINIWLTRYVKGYKYSPQFKMGVWDGQISFFRNGKINLGLWKEALRGCQEIGCEFIIENKQDFPINRVVTFESVKNFCDNFFKHHKVKSKDNTWVSFAPHEHQIKTAFKILKNRYCMAEVATSGGKSLIISIVIFYILSNINKDAKFLIIVPSITLVTQFYDNIVEYNSGENNLSSDVSNKSQHEPLNIRIEEIMSEKPRKYTGNKDANVYIGTYQSLEKWPASFFKKFHTVITDEAHGAKSASIISILSKTFNSAYYRFGLSGTFPGDMTAEILTIQSLLGPKIAEVTASELKEKGIITPMEIKVVIMNHNDEEFDSRLLEIRKANLLKKSYDLEKDYIHLSEKRLDFIKKIIDKCTANTLILFHTIEYGGKILNK